MVVRSRPPRELHAAPWGARGGSDLRSNAPAYGEGMINPGQQPVGDAREDLAAANLAVFLEAVLERGAALEGDPVRDPTAGSAGTY